MERMDEQILPAVYNAIGASFHATPSQLGVLTLARALVQALASPLGGILGAAHTNLTFPFPARASPSNRLVFVSTLHCGVGAKAPAWQHECGCGFLVNGIGWRHPRLDSLHALTS
jgi:hypothetical protein